MFTCPLGAGTGEEVGQEGREGTMIAPPPRAGKQSGHHRTFP